MLGFGFSSGLPYALLVGTITAWLGEVGIKMATIGVLSWIGLSYAFKFLWSPVVDRMPLPLIEALGRRKSWILLCQGVLVLALAGLVVTNPATDIGTFAAFAFAGAFASATQDVAVDAWRIDVADEDVPIELLSPIYQFGYRIASIVGGAFALFLAARMSWAAVYGVMAVMMGVMVLVTLNAPDTPRPEKGKLHAALAQPGELLPAARLIALAVVAIGWIWAITRLLTFMREVLSPTPGAPPASVGDFTKYNAPWVVVATVLVPLIVAATTNWMKARGHMVLTAEDHHHSALRTASNHLYTALVAPLAEFAGRLGWGVLVLIGLILTYALCYNVWVSFAYPFYLEELKYSKDEVAFASKVFGIFMTMLGISLGGYCFARFGRFPTLLLGALLPIVGNLAYADLALGGHTIDAVVVPLFGWTGVEPRMLRLLAAITIENVTVGLAGAAFVAYLSSVVSKSYTAVQYALLSSLTFLIGGLGRGIAGEMIDSRGYAYVFQITALMGVVAVAFVLMEWLRTNRVASRETRG
ncbi:MAG: MFS transporter [Sphingomonadales bacterium]|nr:MFS transporter [Sphingomonadales bacterium]